MCFLKSFSQRCGFKLFGFLFINKCHTAACSVTVAFSAFNYLFLVQKFNWEKTGLNRGIKSLQRLCKSIKVGDIDLIKLRTGDFGYPSPSSNTISLSNVFPM